MPARSPAALARRKAWKKLYDAGRPNRRSKRGPRIYVRAEAREIISIDGEGYGREPHRYVMLTAVGESGWKATLYKGGRALKSVECIEFILSLPKNSLKVTFSFGYDLAKMLEDLPDKKLFELERPRVKYHDPVGAQRWPRKEKLPITWHNYEFMKQATCFMYRRRGGDWRRIWDVWKFAQKSFAWAVSEKGWNVATKEESEFIKKMKDRRAEFTQDNVEEIQAYNELECMLLCKLMRAIINAHNDAGLKLKTFYGPGSTAAVMYQTIAPKNFFKDLKKVKESYSPELRYAIASAFFGGRFEHRVVGEVKNAYEYDINSAYPYEISKLPCVLHGKWVTSNVPPERQDIALVRYSLTYCNQPWGPFPFRERDGSICFPVESAGGWIHNIEWQAALDCNLWQLVFKEAFIFERTCVCPSPFARIGELYQERLVAGKKSGKGQALKLGMNSGYGKMAQSVGSAPYNSWFYAGMITAGTRAQILQALRKHESPYNLLGVATDGILTRERIFPLIKNERLGEWDGNNCDYCFLVRPGIVLGPKLRSRGIGEKALNEATERIKKTWEKNRSLEQIIVASGVTRFTGLKQGVWQLDNGRFVRSKQYGDWTIRPQVVSFNQMPKRSELIGNSNALKPRRLPDIESRVYQRGLVSEEGLQLQLQALGDLDQPDIDDGYGFADE